MWLAQIPSWTPCFQVGYFSLCTAAPFPDIFHKNKCHPKISKTVSGEHLFLHMSALHKTHSAPDRHSPKKTKKNNAQNTKRKLPRKVSSSSMSLCSHCSLQWNGLSNHWLTWGPPPTPGMVWSFHPPKKNDQTSHRFSGFVVLPEILQNLGSHEYTLIWYIHIRAIFVWLATHKITHKLQTWC